MSLQGLLRRAALRRFHNTTKTTYLVDEVGHVRPQHHHVDPLRNESPGGQANKSAAGGCLCHGRCQDTRALTLKMGPRSGSA